MFKIPVIFNYDCINTDFQGKKPWAKSEDILSWWCWWCDFCLPLFRKGEQQMMLIFLLHLPHSTCWKRTEKSGVAGRISDGIQILFTMNSKNKAEPLYLCSCTWALLLPGAVWLLYPVNMGLNETIWHAHTAHSGWMSLCIQPVFQIYLHPDLTWGLWGITVLWSYTAHILTRWIHTSTMVCNWTIPSAGRFKLTVCVLVCNKDYISCTDSECTVWTGESCLYLIRLCWRTW